jgi:hypothetical protein
MKYIGYSKLENFVQRVDPGQLLYLILLEEIIPGTDGIDLFRSEILLQVSVGTGSEEAVFYWRMVIGEAAAPGGVPWPEQAHKIRGAAKSALKAVKDFLAAQDNLQRFEEGALIAMPRDLKLLRGYGECLEFDKDSGTYRLKQGMGKNE